MAKSSAAAAQLDMAGEYTAHDIEVLEGLEPVRRRPGMYIGGTDERALHHLFAEVLDNAVDEAVAGHADRIHVTLHEDGSVSVADNGRGIPVDPHPKFPNKSAAEVILTTLHAGGKFSKNAYQASGGLNGVGVSVVNALSSELILEVARGKSLYMQTFTRGTPDGPLKRVAAAPNRRGTTVRFTPDDEIFGHDIHFRAHRLYAMTRAKAHLHRKLTVNWRCDMDLPESDATPREAVLHFPGGLGDLLTELVGEREMVTAASFVGRAGKEGHPGAVEWAVTWTPAGFDDADGVAKSFCNTIPTPQGGTHESGLRSALTKGLRQYAELVGDKRAASIMPDDVFGGAAALVSVFVRDPEFVGQTKEKLSNADAARTVELAVRDHFDHWLAGAPKEADKLLAFVAERAEERIRRRKAREVARKSATKRLRLPGKLADCTKADSENSEIFLVEGDSAGGSAKQARNRETQAVLPLRGKILNVAQAGGDKLSSNQELSDLALALGVRLGKSFDVDDLRYERVIIMTDADVDGAHIAALLMTFFLRQTPGLIESGRLFLAQPPLYRLSRGGQHAYARDDAHKDELLEKLKKGRGSVTISRFKGLGEMTAPQLRETTMDPASRTLARVALAHGDEDMAGLVETLMGRKPELRYRYIEENARFAPPVDV